jgi:Nif-specific regulatory protein
VERLDLVKRVAPSDASVLILGESGVGKELIAEQLHLNSRRNKKPFIARQLRRPSRKPARKRALRPRKRCIYDAISNREGRFEDRRRLERSFLDEIAELPLKLQSSS